MFITTVFNCDSNNLFPIAYQTAGLMVAMLVVVMTTVLVVTQAGLLTITCRVVFAAKARTVKILYH